MKYLLIDKRKIGTGELFMKISLGILRETKSFWERRTPLVPNDVKSLVQKYPVDIFIQPSERRIYSEKEYIDAGATIREDLSNCSILIGIKEVEIKDFLTNKTYMFFSHTIKGQDYNMPMLQKILDSSITLIDYEKIENEDGKRLIYFSVQAGIAGAIDTIWALGHKFKKDGISTPFDNINQAHQYNSLQEAEDNFRSAGDKLIQDGIPSEISPLVIGIAGYGNVATGVNQIIDLLPYKNISPDDLLLLSKNRNFSANVIYKVIFKEEDMVEPINSKNKFDLQEYYQHPERYKSKFEKYLPHLSVFINAIFWDTPYPVFVTIKFVKELYANNKKPKLSVIGDISCDIEGGVECTLKPTDPGNPVFVYDPDTDSAIDGFEGNGLIIMAVEILPSEIPRESSIYFSSVLSGLIPELIKCDFPNEFNDSNLPYELKNAIIVYKGLLTSQYKYIKKYLID